MGVLQRPLSSYNEGPMEKLVGVWTGRITFGPKAQGQLTITQAGEKWTARIKDFDVNVRLDGNSIHFTLPDREGEFHGHLKQDLSTIEGHWVQPQGHALDVRYATPVFLVKSGPDNWKGNVIPLDDALTIYVIIRKGSDGALESFIRNPEFNIGAGRAFFVAMVGNMIHF